ncbi:MAG: hypothetical protein FWF96_03905, partial [Kiritimatiellaeota bacterium]|nr:hypothetical protein [Kiritimatiellota bacterium]
MLTLDTSLFASCQRVGLAVSGGADSTALAHLLAPWCGANNIAVHILHVNHGWRGAESDADEAFVRGLAQRLGAA